MEKAAEAVGAIAIRKESPAIAVGQFLFEKGFAPARVYGTAVRRPEPANALGILWGSKPCLKRILGLIPIRVPRPFIGVIWFDNPFAGAGPGCWAINSYGPDHYNNLLRFARELALEYGVEVRVKSVSKEERIEQFFA